MPAANGMPAWPSNIVAPTALNNHTTLTFARSDNAVQPGAISGNGSVIQSGAGITTLTGQNTYGGGTVIGNGGIVARNSGNLSSGPIHFTGSGSLAVGGNGSSVSGFGGNGTGWTINRNDTVAAATTIASNVLTLTTNDNGEARSVFYNQPVFVGHSFSSSFTYHSASDGAPADGFAFVLQNDPRGATAVGGGGGSLGYGGTGNSILNSVSPVQVELYPWAGGANTAGYVSTDNSNGSTGPWSSYPWLYGNDINVTVSYNEAAGAFTVNMVQASNTNNNLSATFNVNLQNYLGSSGYAYLGLTGGTGGLHATQTFSNFTFGTSNYVPGAPTYANSVQVDAGVAATIKVEGTPNYPTVTMGNLTLGAGASLAVSASSFTPANGNYGLTLGTAALAGSAAISVANNGTGIGDLTLTGAVSGTGGTLTKGDAGTLSVTGGINHGALTLLDIQAGTLELKTTSVSDAGLNVATAEGGTLLITDHNYTLGSISGAGSTVVTGGTLTATSIVQDSLIIDPAHVAAPVPEPSAIVLLALAGAALSGVCLRRRLR